MKTILFLLFISLFFLLSCNKDFYIENQNDSSPVNIENRLFFIIHGDGSYLYHDQNGNELQADDEILKKAIQTAKSLKNSEVFIFHLKRKNHFLLFFPTKDRDFYYFRNERLITKQSYFSEGNLLSTNNELQKLTNAIYDSHKIARNYFFYYGHEIPENDLTNYDSSFPERRFNIDSLAVILNKLKSKFNTGFELVTLSTCNNGSPYSVLKTLSYSQYVIASPGDLHLSYIDCRNLSASLNNKSASNEVISEFAKSAFDSLCLRTNSVAVLALYKRDLVLPALEKIYKTNKTIFDIPETGSDYTDCTEWDSVFSGTLLKNGTRVFYRAPLFGRMKSVKSHSGWICTKNLTVK